MTTFVETCKTANGPKGDLLDATFVADYNNTTLIFKVRRPQQTRQSWTYFGVQAQVGLIEYLLMHTPIAAIAASPLSDALHRVMRMVDAYVEKNQKT